MNRGRPGITLDGVLTVAEQEFTIRLRAGRWRWLLGAWFALLAVITGLTWLATRAFNEGRLEDRGVVVYGSLMLLVLGLALLVTPSLSAQSVNGDRDRGTLATLQVTRLSAAEIAVGKLLAAWGTALVFVVLTLPLVLFAMTQGGVPFSRVVIVTVVIALVLGSVIAVSLLLSSVLMRTTTSAVLSYLVVFALTIGTTVLFGLATALSTESYTQSYQPCAPEEGCQEETFTSQRARTDRVWWLLAPNPFVILADAAPKLPPESPEAKRRRLELQARGVNVVNLRDSDPLSGIGNAVRSAHKGPDDEGKGKPVWPYGLGFHLLLGTGAVWLTARRLQTPTRNLPMGQRVA